MWYRRNQDTSAVRTFINCNYEYCCSHKFDYLHDWQYYTYNTSEERRNPVPKVWVFIVGRHNPGGHTKQASPKQANEETTAKRRTKGTTPTTTTNTQLTAWPHV